MHVGSKDEATVSEYVCGLSVGEFPHVAPASFTLGVKSSSVFIQKLRMPSLMGEVVDRYTSLDCRTCSIEGNGRVSTWCIYIQSITTHGTHIDT